MKLSPKHLGTSLLLASLLSAPTALLADHHEGGDPTGTWTWTRPGRDGNEVTSTLKLKADGDKLTGKISGWNNTENDISNGKVKGNEISFDVAREFNGNSMTIQYAGKIEGDSLTGDITVSRDGQERTREWTAKRASAGLDGNWVASITRDSGEAMELNLSFKVDGEKVTGAIKVNEFEIPLEGTFKGGAVNYQSKVERDGNTWTSTFIGKVDGDTLTGESTSNRNGQERTRKIVAKRAK
jgi:hypothetical protein